MVSATIETKLLEHVRDALSSAVDHASVVIDGTAQQYPISNTVIDGLRVYKYIYVQDDVSAGAEITAATLCDAAGVPLSIQNMQITKGGDGVLVAFKFEVKVVGV